MRGQVLFAKLGNMSTATIPLRVPTFDLSDRLRKARESAGFDQVQLSEQIGISRTSISAAERGSSKPRKAVLIAWAFATRVPIEQIAADERDATQRRSALAAAPSAPEDYAIQDERTGTVILHAFHGSIDGGDAA